MRGACGAPRSAYTFSADAEAPKHICRKHSLQYHVDLQAEANQLARREGLPTSHVHRSVARMGVVG